MSIARFVCLALAGMMGLAGARDASAQTYYLWKDSNGNIAMADSLPPGVTHYSKYKGPGPARSTAASPVSAKAARPIVEEYASQYDSLIEQYASSNSIRPDLVRAVIQVESAFNPNARSSKGAMGLMQLMPGTAQDLGVLNAYDAEDNIRGGVRYLRLLLDRYSNNETLALAAYNAGPEAVGKYGNAVPPYAETQDYVGKVQSISPQSSTPSLAALAARTAPAPPPAPRPQGVRTIYKTIVIGPDGQPIARYTDTKPASGEYEIYSYRR